MNEGSGFSRCPQTVLGGRYMSNAELKMEEKAKNHMKDAWAIALHGVYFLYEGIPPDSRSDSNRGCDSCCFSCPDIHKHEIDE